MKTLSLSWTLTPDSAVLAWPDGSAETVPLADLWPATVTDRQILHNLQLSAAICGIPDPTADTLRQLINLTRGGLKIGAPPGRIFLGLVRPTQTGFFLTYGPTTDATVYGFHITADDWHTHYTTTADLVANAAAAMKLAKLTTTELAAAQDLLNTTIFRAH